MSPRERRTEAVARVLVIALALAAPVVFTLRAARIQPLEKARPKVKSSGLVVVTTSVWPALPGESEPSIGELAQRAAHVDQCYSPSRSPAGAAASLWTGRYPMHHGVSSNRLGLPEDAWTLARSASSAGARTAAFLEEPFVSVTGIGGFETVVEDPTLGFAGLAELASAFLAEHAGERTCLWLHLARPGPGARDLAQLLDRVGAAITDPVMRLTTMWIVTGFASSPPRSPPGPGFRSADAQARVDLWAALPSGINARHEGQGAASLIDVAGAVCEILALPLPGPRDAFTQSDGRALGRNLGGGGGYPWLFLEDERGWVLRFREGRVASADETKLVAETTTRPQTDDGFAPAPPDEATKLLGQYEQFLRLVQKGALPAVLVQADPRWSALGW